MTLRSQLRCLAALALLIASALSVRAQGDGKLRHAAVVVQYSPGQLASRCVGFDEETISGYDLLTRAGFGAVAEGSAGLGAMVCSIDGVGCDYPNEPCACQCQGGDCTYWSYTHLVDGAWRYSTVGASSYRVRDGAIDGWTWAAGSVQQGGSPPLVSFAAVCGAQLAPPTTPPAPPTETPVPAPTNPPAPTNTPAPPTDTPAPAATRPAATATPAPPTATAPPAASATSAPPSSGTRPPASPPPAATTAAPASPTIPPTASQPSATRADSTSATGGPAGAAPGSPPGAATSPATGEPAGAAPSPASPFSATPPATGEPAGAAPSPASPSSATPAPSPAQTGPGGYLAFGAIALLLAAAGVYLRRRRQA